ncbi:MAG: acetate kinase [Lentisphaerae bacterium]|nr:acetate kinase [Lentisphaerota bacterium]
MKTLIINAGSSSVKFTLYQAGTEQRLAKGLIERVKQKNTTLIYSNHRGQKMTKGITANSYEAAISEACLTLIDKNIGVIDNLSEIQAIGHRIVHGGPTITKSVRITRAVKQTIQDCISLAPLHNPPNYEGIEACEQLLPNLPMVAVFDTAFHQSMPPQAYTYAIPSQIAEKHKIRRYGFHGTSHQYVSLTAAEMLDKPLDNLKLITAHLGNGSSITAINKGQVIDTSMGFTPLEGLMMGTRSGDADPAIVLFLGRAGYSLEEIDHILNKESGLLGLADIGSNDMRDVLDAVDERKASASLALSVFLHRLVKYIGAYAAILGGFDALIFTAGIGENCSRIRSMVCSKLDFLGIDIDAEKNNNNETFISKPNTKPEVLVVPTNEELMIVRETMRVLTTE